MVFKNRNIKTCIPLPECLLVHPGRFKFNGIFSLFAVRGLVHFPAGNELFS